MVVSTMREQRLGREIVKDFRAKKPRNKKELLVASGYSESSATSVPGRILSQPGVITAIEVESEKAGFTEERAKQVVAEIMNQKHAEHKDRLKAAELVFKVRGSFAAEKSISLEVNTEDLKAKILEDMARFRGNNPNV